MRRPVSSAFIWSMCIAVSITAAGLICIWQYGTEQAIEATTTQLLIQEEAFVRQITQQESLLWHAQTPPVIKGIYLTAYSAGSAAKRKEMIELISTTELNAVVIDIKDYSGAILYDSDIALVEEIGAEDNRLGDIANVIAEFHDAGMYVIARQTVFQDPLLAQKKPEWALQQLGGGLWRDYKGLAWVDPNEQAVWEYNMAIATEAASLGFDEINLDYVRFPSDGNTSQIVYTHTGEKHDVMKAFYTYVGDTFDSLQAWVSLDLFGFVMERHDGMNIGQRLEDAVDTVDYISPMMYPSHYPSGHLGLDNPAAAPFVVIDNGMQKGLPYFVDRRAQVRPWIQAFHLGARYDAANIRAQIDAIEQYDNAGWLLWNASNRYSNAGLLQE